MQQYHRQSAEKKKNAYLIFTSSDSLKSDKMNQWPKESGKYLLTRSVYWYTFTNQHSKKALIL